ncbi:MAG: sigma-70 family RNA polymerase sigma factor [Candidatus Promineifilaceae bacterium]
MITPEVVSEFNLSSDGELIAACQDGKEVAWDALVARYEQLVYTVMDRCKLELSEEGEIFQSVWLSFLKNLDSLGRTKRVAAWLVAATRNEIGRRRHDPEYTIGTGSDKTNDERVLIDQEDLSLQHIVSQYSRYEVTCRAFMKMDARSQRLLTMLYGEPTIPPDEEIAAKLSVPVDSVEQLRVHSLKTLRQTITDFT